jgi:hypothetical protein
MSLRQWTLYAESKEWVGPISVTVNGQPASSFELSIIPALNGRPIGPWVSPLAAETALPDGNAGQGLGLVVGPGTDFPLSIGSHLIVARYATDLEAPIIEVGIINVK